MSEIMQVAIAIQGAAKILAPEINKVAQAIFTLSDSVDKVAEAIDDAN